jgi:hypothetical protein
MQTLDRMAQLGMPRTHRWLGQQMCEHVLSRTILDLDVIARHFLPTKVIRYVHVLAPTSCHDVLAKSNATLVVLVDGDGGARFFMKLMHQLS